MLASATFIRSEGNHRSGLPHQAIQPMISGARFSWDRVDVRVDVRDQSDRMNFSPSSRPAIANNATAAFAIIRFKTGSSGFASKSGATRAISGSNSGSKTPHEVGKLGELRARADLRKRKF